MVATPFLAMREDGTCPSTYHSPSASVEGWTDNLKRDIPAYPYDSQVSEGMPFLDTAQQLGGSGYRGESRVPRSQMSCESMCIEGCDPKGHSLTCHPAAAASSMSPLKPSKVRYRCCICRKDFSQKRGVTRHYRDVHEVSLCLHCSGFEWHRRYKLEEHLKEQHPDIHVATALAETTRYRRRATIIKNRLQGQQTFPPAVEHYRSSSGEHLPQPLSPPLPPVLDVTYVSSQGSDGGSTLHNGSFQPPSEGVSFTSPDEYPEHYQEKHQPGIECSHPDCVYKWTSSRGSDYRKHLEKKHRLENDKRLAMAPRLCHNSGSAIESDLLPHFSPPPIERDRQSLAESLQCRQMLPLLSVGNDTNHASPPLIPSVAYNPRLGDAEPEITTNERENPSGLKHHAATHAPSRSFSAEDILYMIDSALRFPSVHPEGPTTADIPPNPGMLHTPEYPYPVAGYYTSPVSGHPPLLPWRMPRRH